METCISLLLVTSCMMIASLSATFVDPGDDEHISYEYKTKKGSTVARKGFSFDTMKQQWRPVFTSEGVQQNGSTPRGAGKKKSLEALYQRALSFALHEFWDLKTYIHRITRECDALQSKGIIIEDVVVPLQNATDAIDIQTDRVIAMLTQDAKYELIDPVEETVVDRISEYFKSMNRSLHEYRSGIEDQCNFLEMVAEVNGADEKLNAYYNRTSRYLNRVKTEILTTKAKSRPSQPYYSKTPASYSIATELENNQYSHSASDYQYADNGWSNQPPYSYYSDGRFPDSGYEHLYYGTPTDE